MNIASIDLKGAYDGVSHEYLFIYLRIWKRQGFYGNKTLEAMRFLYSQYKLGIVESKN